MPLAGPAAIDGHATRQWHQRATDTQLRGTAVSLPCRTPMMQSTLESRVFAPLGLLVAFTSGCAEDVRDPCSHSLCSIDSEACVQQVAETVACQLDLSEATIPEVRMLTAAQVVAEFDTQPPTAEQIANITHYYRGEGLFGLMPSDYEYESPSANYVDWAIAFYSSDTKDVVIITDNVGEDIERAYIVLAHEMVHVHQDAHRDLEAMFDTHSTTFDRALGLRAAIEGEAELYESLAAVELLGYTPEDVDWFGYFEDYQSFAFEQAANSEEPSLDALAYFPYAFGGEMVHRAWTSDGHPGIDGLMAMPPDSVQQVMAGYDAWPEAGRNRDDRLDPHAAPIVPERYRYLGGGHQSIWLLNAMLQRTAGYAGQWAGSELRQISADYLSIFRDEESGELVGLWRIQSTGEDYLRGLLLNPAGLWTEDEGEPTSHLVSTVGDDLLLVATSGPDARAVLEQVQGWQSTEEINGDWEGANARPGPPLIPEALFPAR